MGEVLMDRKRNFIEIFQGKSEKIQTSSNKKLTFKSINPNIVAVNDSGIMTAKSIGNTIITVEDKEANFHKKFDIRVLQQRSIRNNLPTYKIEPKNQVIIDREKGQYIGHPDSILLDDDQTILTVYPLGHGIGEAVINKSFDGGFTWEGRETPNLTWKDSRETPTIYKLDFRSGKQVLISISGGPGWGEDGFRGWKTSLSFDNGQTWSDYRTWFEGTQTIVAMSSLVQLKDKNGDRLDRWMGIFHDGQFVNYKTILSFTENGKEIWSTPEPLLKEHREIEKEVQLCEACIIRSPDKKQLALLARSQSHMHTSTISFSNDEGETWTKPREVPGSLNGERHKAAYDPISGRLVISFREIILDYNNNGIIEDDGWKAGDWVAWVGTYDDLVEGNEGEFRILLGKDYTPSRKGGDCGYAGNIVMKDGTFFLNSYGYFDQEEVEQLGTEAKPYIMGVRFKLDDFK